MRVIKEIVFADCKVSIFYMNQKYIIKFEQGILEQTYKLSEIDFVIEDVVDVEKIITIGLIEKVSRIFLQMKFVMSEATIDLV